MVDTIFKTYSKPIGTAYKRFIEQYFCIHDENLTKLFNLYKDYAVLDSNFPRPILTYLGVTANSNKLQNLSEFEDLQLLFVPQLIRDFGAIHDDIVDEDLIKFNQDSLPFAFSKMIEPNSISMNKWGKDLALLLADMQLSAPLQIITSIKVNAEIKQKILALVSQLLYTTNKGQIDELLLIDKPLKDISSEEIYSLYKNKAADYCYAFPLTLGMVYSEINQQTINDLRSIMLTLGTYSQIVNDIEGVFYEYFSNERNTLSDLTLLRRTYLLLTFYHKTTVPKNKALLEQSRLSQEQANDIKEEMIKANVITDIKKKIESGCLELEEAIQKTEVGDILKNYLIGLINNRIIANMDKL